jgi:sugar phosphate isomerase/epimerase
MIAYGFPRGHLETDVAIAHRLGARCVEVLPDWRALPDPKPLRSQLADAGLVLHSAHGCWGGQAIRAERVDLGDTDAGRRQTGIDDIARCVDWLAEAGGTHLVIHPGGYSDPAEFEARGAALADSLSTLADHARGTGVLLCVENMPPGVHPGSRMADLFAIVADLDRPEVALALDTGHAHISANVADETLAAGALLRTTHVHDNDGRQDAHLPPGLGTVPWDAWIAALDAIAYRGPILLECIRQLRERPDTFDEALLARLRSWSRREAVP